jgi:DNA-binding transcriptional regulator YiaG
MKKSILEVVHESAKGLLEIGLIDAKTMHSFDAKCLPPVKKFTPRGRRHNSPHHLKRLLQIIF